MNITHRMKIDEKVNPYVRLKILKWVASYCNNINEFKSSCVMNLI